MAQNYNEQTCTVQNSAEVVANINNTVTGNDIANYVFEGIKSFISEYPNETGLTCSVGMTAVGLLGSFLFGRRVFLH